MRSMINTLAYMFRRIVHELLSLDSVLSLPLPHNIQPRIERDPRLAKLHMHRMYQNKNYLPSPHGTTENRERPKRLAQAY